MAPRSGELHGTAVIGVSRRGEVSARCLYKRTVFVCPDLVPYLLLNY